MKMRRLSYIWMIVLLALSGCHGIEPLPAPGTEPGGDRVTLSFKVAVPGEADGTRAMGNNPTIDPDGFYIAVFGGSGYFNEWVKATVAAVSPANYDTTAATVYTLTATLSISDSRLRLHFIANCPVAARTSPPISGSQDTEEYVLSRIRSKHTESYNDAYWQKVILPNGIRVNKVVEEETEYFQATPETLAQFPDPIILVRNFARVYLRNLTKNFTFPDNPSRNHQLVIIKKFGLAYAPSEGVVAPILSTPFITDAAGNPIPEPADNDSDTRVYFESFLMNYQRYPIALKNPGDTLLTADPFNYGGFSPADQAYNYYPSNDDPGVPVEADLQVWDNENPENNVLFVYERTKPSAARRATRLIIMAERIDIDENTGQDVSEGDKFYALDIVNTEGVAIPLLRNQSYTVHLLNIEAGSGESDITNASKASSASVSGDPNFQQLINISDGRSSIGTSFTEKFYVQPQLDSVMFRYIPTSAGDDDYDANQEGNELVTIQTGSYNPDDGTFTPLTAAEAAAQNALAFATEADTCKVWIVKEGGQAVPFVRSQNKWVKATQAQIDNPDIEKWGMIKFQLNTTDVAGDYFSAERTQTIHVVGTYNGNELSRNVVIKISRRQTMMVQCQQKYVEKATGEQEVVRVLIPRGLSRSVFPLDFTLESDKYSLTPNGDVLPVTYGSTTVPGNSGPAYYFVKTVTQAEYDELGTVSVNGEVWKYFDCHFKTTLVDNASTVYVQNKYFDNATSYDDYFNYQQRRFSHPTLPNTVYRNGNTTVTFSLDPDHTTPLVWWDPTNSKGRSANVDEAVSKGVSETNRVLPLVFTVELIGFTPQYLPGGETPVTTNLQHWIDNKYLYYVLDGEPRDPRTADANNITLALTATGAVGSTAWVKLSTENLTENTSLYLRDSVSTSIQGAEFTNLTFSPNTVRMGLNQATTFSFNYVDGLVEPITITLTGLTLNGADPRMVSQGNGVYLFTPSNTNQTQSISLKSTTRYGSCTVRLESDDYVAATQTANRSLMIPSGTIYARGYGNVNPTKLANNTNVIISATKDGTQLAAINFNTTTYYSSTDGNITNTNGFGTLSDTTPVYFRYVNTNTYYGSALLGDILDAIEGSTYVPVNFYRWATGSFQISIQNNYNSMTSTDATSGITAVFANCSDDREGLIVYRNYRRLIGTTSNDGTVTMSAASSPLTGCKITGGTITYYNNSNGRNVSINPGTVANNKGSWTASSTGEGNGDVSEVLTMAKGNNTNQINKISSMTINYGYWDY